MRIQFVYLTSPPFSGSTLFSFLVNTHPQIATVGEMTGPIARQDPETYKCSCGKKIRECNFWQQVAARMSFRSLHFDPGSFDTKIRLGNTLITQCILSGSLGNTAVENTRDWLLTLLPSQSKRLRYLIHRNKALTASILEVTGKSVFFDASKNPITIRHLSKEPDVDLRVVHLVRDVRGASLSKRKNQGKTNWERNVTGWVRANRNIERHLNSLAPDKWIRIRYEDLCRAPQVTLDRFYRFCNLEPHSMPQEFSNQDHHIIGNRMRLSNIGQLNLDENWRRALTPAELNLASKLAGPVHVRYGYTPMETADLTG